MMPTPDDPATEPAPVVLERVATPANDESIFAALNQCLYCRQPIVSVMDSPYAHAMSGLVQCDERVPEPPPS